MQGAELKITHSNHYTFVYIFLGLFLFSGVRLEVRTKYLNSFIFPRRFFLTSISHANIASTHDTKNE